MPADPSGKTERTKWSLSTEALDALLRSLDPDRDQAAEAYAKLRERIAGLFGWWGRNDGDDLTDETLDRVARKILGGAPIPDGSLGAYVRGVARLVFYEASRRPVSVPIEAHEIEAPSTGGADEGVFACLDRCLGSLRREDRDLVMGYYARGHKADTRRRLAGEAGLSATALRIRAHRIRQRLEACVRRCVHDSREGA